LTRRVPDAPNHLDRCWLELDQKRKLRVVDEQIGLASAIPVIS
jgi:hypothetical protein